MDPLPKIEVDVDLGLRELFRASLSIMIYNLRYLIGGVAILAAIYVASVLAASSDTAAAGIAEAIESLTLPLLLGGLPTVVILIPVFAFVRSRQVLKAEGMDGKRHYVFSDAGIAVQSRLASAEVKWEAYSQVRETRHYFLLYAAPGFANVISKRSFANQSSIAAFRSLVRAHARKVKLRG